MEPWTFFTSHGNKPVRAPTPQPNQTRRSTLIYRNHCGARTMSAFTPLDWLSKWNPWTTRGHREDTMYRWWHPNLGIILVRNENGPEVIPSRPYEWLFLWGLVPSRSKVRHRAWNMKLGTNPDLYSKLNSGCLVFKVLTRKYDAGPHCYRGQLV